MKIVFASHNQNKAKEIRSVLPQGIKLLTLNDLNCLEEIPENEPTIEGNSAFKANWVFNHFGMPCFADDTGLEVRALNGAPGVHSARYAGETKNDEANMNKLLKALEPFSDRTAQFKTVITFRDQHREIQFTGVVSGQIGTSKKGEFGFGYDPIFFPEDAVQTFAEMTLLQKNKFSHRARAMAQFLEFLAEHT